MKRELRRTLMGALFIFLGMAAFMTITMFIYSLAAEKYEGDVAAISIIMLLCVVFFSLACTVIDLMRRIAATNGPLKEILAATERIQSGDFSVRLAITRPENRYDEFDCIKANLNAMTEALAASRATSEQFIANASHELKTPVAVIQSYASALYSGDLTEDERRQYTLTLLETSKRMAAMIENILKLNKLENGKILSALSRFELSENIAQAVIDFEDAAEKKNITLDCDFEEMDVYSYPDCLSVVWSNLLSNAIKFCDDGGHIKMSLKRDGDRAIFNITDDGCGMSPEEGKRIFDKFYQGDTSHSSEGNGLGLAMVKKVIDLIGGEIKVESRAGEGSSFTVVIDTEVKNGQV